MSISRERALAIRTGAKKAAAYKAESPTEEMLLREVDRVFTESMESLLSNIQDILKEKQ